MQLIGSVLRDLDRPTFEQSMAPHSPTQHDQLAEISRLQIQCLRNQELLSRKLDEIMALLTPTVAVIPPVAHQRPVTQLPGLPLHVPYITPTQRPVTQLPDPPSHAPPTQRPATMPPIPSENHSVTQEDGDELPQFAHEELFQLKNVAMSRSNFAVLLLRKSFQPSELE